MMRVPVISTILVAAAVAFMVWLGLWQLPPVNLDAMPLSEAANHPFRRAHVTCRIEDARPDQRAGRNLDGQGGYRFLIPCRPVPDGEEPPLLIDIGWTRDPRVMQTASLDGRLSGTLSAGGEGFAIFLTSDTPVPPLQASQPPSPDQIPDNHLMYAWQWFLFAATAIIIYIVALRGRRRRR
jgi:surfeit locus 1 family protein